MKQIWVSDSVHRVLKEKKGLRSFSSLIESMLNSYKAIDVNAELIAKFNSLQAQVDKVEAFVSAKSGGQYDS